SGEEKYTFSSGPWDCFNRVVDNEAGTTYIGLNPAYNIVFNMTSAQADIDISNLKFSSSNSGITLRLPSLPLKQDPQDAFYTASGMYLTPVGQTSSFVFDSFNFRGYPFRSIPAYIINYTVNSRYDVTVYPTLPTYVGSVSATNLEPEEGKNPVFNLNPDGEAYYQLLINPENMTAMFHVANAKFADGMSRYSFATKGLKVELTSEGYRVAPEAGKEYNIYSPQSVSSDTATPIPGCTISDLRVNAVLSTGASISFTCDLGDMGKYSVNAILRYLIYNTEETDKQ
ncbi:MAG: hypothetical protein K2G71_03065, partial [Duncaniella sp.]|nr:hypothetical protein [Duncaniella sp.]